MSRDKVYLISFPVFGSSWELIIEVLLNGKKQYSVGLVLWVFFSIIISPLYLLFDTVLE